MPPLFEAIYSQNYAVVGRLLMYGANPWYQGVNLVKLVVQSGDPELVKMLQGTGSLEPVSILLSVHASLKLFIASDNTPLSFSQFERRDLFTNSPQLLRAAALHYASGTLYRAGWVLGSLEILGNPTGLVRNVGIGISDMFRMPYHGLTQGPGAFVGGVTRGMGSLVRHISTGTGKEKPSFLSSF